MERYTNINGETWIRIKFMDVARTEKIMLEEEFEKQYEKDKLIGIAEKRMI